MEYSFTEKCPVTIVISRLTRELRVIVKRDLIISVLLVSSAYTCLVLLKREEVKLLGKVKADLHYALPKIRHIWCYQPAAVACS